MTSNSWIKCFQPNPQAKLRLFCLPYAGGSAAVFRPWSSQLPEMVEVCALELPGHGSRVMETPFTEMSPLIEALGSALSPHFNKPYAFLGYSFGALIGFELARYCQRHCPCQPVYLFACARSAPHLPILAPLHALPESEFLQELHRLNGTPKAVLENSELIQLLMPTLRADLTINETHEVDAEAPLAIPIAAFGGWQDPTVSVEQLEAWRRHTSAKFSLQMLPGDHFFIKTSQSLLLEELTKKLNQVSLQL